ncbi:hypothetical protein [Dyadobacter aurulentus]|uniref:hypothetical protein n=1 Tax=Dyadobacter sp. UC 10 TaxID=2605428 RepID=UPI0011F35DFD|nr:hypothetical protein [Dyadobacter sp. UC 10]KAA0990684.1 hypothetical protein FXO21_11260 [Dyadobacter sp. UC 10]
MKSISKCAGLLFLPALVLYSCRTVYAPNAVNAPLLQEKGEFKAAVATNNLQLAAGVTEHVGIMVNGFLNSYTSDDKSFKNNGKGAEVGIGYFGHTEQRISYEAYAGAGLYNVRMRESNNTKTFDTDAVKYFIQPSVGWVTQYFDVALTPRFTMVKYKSPELTGYSPQEISGNYFNVLDQKMHAFFEPALTVRGGYRFVKLQLQYGHSFKMTKNNINYDSDIGSIGLIFDIGNWYKK